MTSGSQWWHLTWLSGGKHIMTNCLPFITTIRIIERKKSHPSLSSCSPLNCSYAFPIHLIMRNLSFLKCFVGWCAKTYEILPRNRCHIVHIIDAHLDCAFMFRIYMKCHWLRSYTASPLRYNVQRMCSHWYGERCAFFGWNCSYSLPSRSSSFNDDNWLISVAGIGWKSWKMVWLL